VGVALGERAIVVRRVEEARDRDKRIEEECMMRYLVNERDGKA
jgi:hypothetical protein